jgi:glycosyltransferase involved in cell wall biosynthesis
MKPLLLMSGVPVGEAERITVSLLRHIQEAGERVPLCTVAPGDDDALARELATAGIARFDLGARRQADPQALARLVALLRRQGFDLVHAHGQDAAVLAYWARRAARFRLVVTGDTTDEPAGDRNQSVRARAARAALTAADAVIADSHTAAARLSGGGQAVRREKIGVIPKGIDVARFDPAANAAAGRALRRKLAPGATSHVVLLPADLNPGKARDVVLEAAHLVRDRIPGVAFLVAGPGAADGIDAPVRFLGHRDDMPALMAAADVVCLPSRSEAAPAVLMEAAAAARAVVAARVGGATAVVEHGRTGLLIAPLHASALAGALIELLEVPGRRGTMGEAAREKARREFGLESQAQRTVSLWQRVLSEDTP